MDGPEVASPDAEQVLDLPVDREEPLSLSNGLKAAHLSFLFTAFIARWHHATIVINHADRSST